MRVRLLLGASIPAVAVVLLLALAGTRPAPKAFQTEAPPDGPVADVSAGRVCQADVVPRHARFTQVVLALADAGRPTAPVNVTVLSDDGERLAGGRIGTDRESAPDGSIARLDAPVAADQVIRLCVSAPRERHPVQLYGSTNPRIADPLATFRGSEIGARMFAIYAREGTSRIDAAGELVDRASLLRAPWLAPWMLWVLVGLVLAAVPLLLGVALWRSRER